MQYAFPYILFVLYLEALALIFATDESLSPAPAKGSPVAVRPLTQRQYRCVALAVVGFLFFFGLRGFILSDWIGYYPFFFDCTLDDVFSYTPTEQGLYEPGFTLLTLLCRSIFRDYNFFVFVCCLINTALLLNFFRRRISNIPLCLLLFVVFEGLVMSTNLMRNSLAILIFLNALPYLEQRRPLPYFALCLLACTFHISAVLYLPLYFFLHRRLNKWVFLAIFLACNALFLLHVSVVSAFLSVIGLEDFSARIRAYTEFYDEATGLSIGYLERLFTGLLVFLYMDKLRTLRSDADIFINALLIYLTFFLALSEFQVLSKRLCVLFAFGYWIVWADLIRCFSIRGNRKLFATFVCLYCVLRMAGTAYLPDFKYDNILLGTDSFQERLQMHNKTYEGD